MNNKAKRKDILVPSYKMVEDFLALSQRILMFAGQDNTRIEFLRGVSTVIQNFCGCDVVEFCIEEDVTQYYWKAVFSPDESFTYELMPRICCDIDNLMNIEMQLDHPNFCISLLARQLNNNLPGVTNNGSFWTGDAENPFIFPDADESNQISFHIGEGYNSIVLIPFETNENNQGILQLKSLKKYHFTENEVEFFEGISRILGMVVVYRRTRAAMVERVKELTCLYEISQIVNQPGRTLEELLQAFVELLPPAMKYPGIAMARIVFDKKSYITKGFSPSKYTRNANLVVSNSNRGFIEVAYREEEPIFVADPFLKEEERLLETVAHEISLIIEERETSKYKAMLQEQLRHSDRLATIGQLAAGVAHELNEPLGSILGFAQLIKKAGDLPNQSEEDIDRIVNASLHAREIVKRLLIFARQMPGKTDKVDLNKIVREGLYFIESRIARENIELEINLADNLPVIAADPTQLHQVLVNLVVNALQSLYGEGKLIISTEFDENNISLIIEDTGAGISRELLPQIFNPFFTTKDVGQGTGLGLSVVHGIVTSHGGDIRVTSEEGVGSRFEVKIPISSDMDEKDEL
ncbi:hypothetical protein J7L05_08680 [bacterium]|nr:hypothetical protein [bacterium]